MSASQENQPTLDSVAPRFLVGDMEQALAFYGHLGNKSWLRLRPDTRVSEDLRPLGEPMGRGVSLRPPAGLGRAFSGNRAVAAHTPLPRIIFTQKDAEPCQIPP